MTTLPAGAESIERPQTLFNQRPIQAAPISIEFPIDHLGVRFDLPTGMDAHDVDGQVAVRFRHDGAWSRWTTVQEDDAQQQGRWTGALVDAGDAEAYQVRGIPMGARAARAAAINTTDGPAEVIGYRTAGSADAIAVCRSRADWGAPETLKNSSRSFAPLQLLTVHHTAGDTATAMSDPDAVVRGIYTWHTAGNGWDDIGYQALISPDGTLYEGRWSGSASRSCLTQGGDGSDFAHAATSEDVVTGAHAGGHNTGNLGVAVLGTYTDALPAAAARATLVAYLAELSVRHGLDPTGTVAYDNSVNAGSFPSVAGHRDLNATECPGGAMYADLPQLRTDVATAMAGGGGSGGGATMEVVAHAEEVVAGTVGGTYVATTTPGGGAESITEVESGGKPAQRYAHLEHRWLVDLPSTGPWTLKVDATATSADDDFAFAVSSDGANWIPLVTIPTGASGTFSGALPDGTNGTVRIRVVDTVRTAGARQLDTLTVDHLRLVSGSAAPEAPAPAEPADPAITLSGTGSKEKGLHRVDLTWAGATAVVIERGGDSIATVVSGSSFTDLISAKGTAAYTYRVCAGATCSAYVTVTF